MDSRGPDRRCFEAGASCDPAAQKICSPRAKSRAASNSLIVRLASRCIARAKCAALCSCNCSCCIGVGS